MNRQQAIKALGLEPNCSAEQMRQKWSELNERTQQKLAAVSDESSQQKYRLRIDSLNEIAHVLWPNDHGNADVPRIEPVHQPKSVVAPVSKGNTPLSFTQMLDLPAPSPSAVLSPSTGETPSISRFETGPVELQDPLELIVEIAPGTVLADRYVVQRQLGAGGMGVVYAVEDRVRHESVALKVVRPELLRSSEAQIRFREEAKLASNLSHPGLVRVYDMWQTGKGLNFLTMELLQGQSLRDEIKQRILGLLDS